MLLNVRSKGSLKIGIVTYFRVPNYGAMLQAYALWQMLRSMGHEVVFISCPFSIATRIPLWRCFISRSWKCLKKKLEQFVRYPITEFAAVYPQTKVCYTVEDCRAVVKDCGVLITGSDQMWNPAWNFGENLRFVMLDFAAVDAKRIAYAVSFGVKEWHPHPTDVLARELLKQFSAISVREESGVALVRELSGRTDTQCVLDPTLLFPAAFYRENICTLASGNLAFQTPYIFRYMLKEWADERADDAALKIAKEVLGLSEVCSDCVPANGVTALFYRMLGVSSHCSVPAWVNTIAHADFVFTNSFHGTVFAVLLHKPFVSLLLTGKMSGMNERALSLLSALNLENHAVFSEDISGIRAAAKAKIDWNAVDEKLHLLRTSAIEWLKKELER